MERDSRWGQVSAYVPTNAWDKRNKCIRPDNIFNQWVKGFVKETTDGQRTYQIEHKKKGESVTN